VALQFSKAFSHIFPKRGVHFVTPLLVTMLLDEPQAWLGARTYSLVLVQVLRGNRHRRRQ